MIVSFSLFVRYRLRIKPIPQFVLIYYALLSSILRYVVYVGTLVFCIPHSNTKIMEKMKGGQVGRK